MWFVLVALKLGGCGSWEVSPNEAMERGDEATERGVPEYETLESKEIVREMGGAECMSRCR